MVKGIETFKSYFEEYILLIQIEIYRGSFNE